jgi:antitoxin component HigA of HigAB toxin-antitoxin module
MQVDPAFVEAGYTQTLIEIGHLIASDPDCRALDGQRLEALTRLAEAYEADLYLLDFADIEAA